MLTEADSEKGSPPKSVYSAVYISGFALNRGTAVIGPMESYRVHKFELRKAVPADEIMFHRLFYFYKGCF